MESQVVKRRMNTIAGHLATTAEDVSTFAPHIFPVNCSSSLKSVIRRCDNRIHFARQGSSSQACFMRQALREKVLSAKSDAPVNSTGSANKDSSKAFEEPLFSRPSSVQPNVLNVGLIQPVLQECKLPAPPEPPKFGRPHRRIGGQQQFCSRKKNHAFESNGFERSPRMDVTESGRNYILMVELPGVSISDIRVEINDQTLTVMGTNSTRLWRVASANDRVSTYHKRDISQGPYQVVWQLPSIANKDSISAEFVDGLLQITIPKL
ncbi:uncharacterized protein LOC130792324 [Actinidia eriantha]|uniref:uncharacterized protein LOC130792324 n=1 Tax=Actinidia eriantha TaxID=165200 RepID=UPI002587ABED|nr:uncharacterized protein LOC130792324 [Actinidia eriantha]